MTVTHERWAQGLRADEYKAQMTRNQDQFAENERTIILDADDLAFFQALPAPLPVLVLAEDWCGDVIANLPVLLRLADESGKLDVRIFPRDQHLDLMDLYLNQGQHRSIPVFVLFDPDFRELGHWIERPATMTALHQQLMASLMSEPVMADVTPGMSPAQMPEAARTRMMQAFGEFRASHRAQSDQEVVRDLRRIVEQGVVSTDGAAA